MNTSPEYARILAYFRAHQGLETRLLYVDAQGRTEKGLRIDHAKAHGFGEQAEAFYAVARSLKHGLPLPDGIELIDTSA